MEEKGADLGEREVEWSSKALTCPVGALELDSTSEVSSVREWGAWVFKPGHWSVTGCGGPLEKGVALSKASEGVSHSFLQRHLGCTYCIHHRHFYVSILRFIYMCICLNSTSKLESRNCLRNFQSTHLASAFHIVVLKGVLKTHW